VKKIQKLLFSSLRTASNDQPWRASGHPRGEKTGSDRGIKVKLSTMLIHNDCISK